LSSVGLLRARPDIIRLTVITRRSIINFLLTSAGIKNKSILDALVALLGKPLADCNALCIPTAENK
jgi:hypothetical protein